MVFPNASIIYSFIADSIKCIRTPNSSENKYKNNVSKIKWFWEKVVTYYKEINICIRIVLEIHYIIKIIKHFLRFQFKM